MARSSSAPRHSCAGLACAVGLTILLWNSSTRAGAVSYRAIDLGQGVAYAVDAGQQVGYSFDADRNQHAALWRGSASSRVDLHPGAYEYSTAYAVSAGVQGG